MEAAKIQEETVVASSLVAVWESLTYSVTLLAEVKVLRLESHYSKLKEIHLFEINLKFILKS